MKIQKYSKIPVVIEAVQWTGIRIDAPPFGLIVAGSEFIYED